MEIKYDVLEKQINDLYLLNILLERFLINRVQFFQVHLDI